MKNENTIASKTMTITLYNYDNKPMQFELPLENLAYVEIEVLSGDEVMRAYYKNGRHLKFDSANDRMVNYDYDDYFVNVERLTEWNTMKFSNRIYLYERATKSWD